jgi:glycosyltransferase involved in cell wall biosynthesis
MDGRPRYLVAVPYHSRPELLREALESVVAQDDPDWECVVVDDSPPGDEVEPVLRAFHDPRLTSVRNPSTLGVAGNFNRCFDIARRRGAELAVILHADDVLEPWYVSTMRAAHAHHPEAACVAPRVTVIDARGRPARTVPDTVKSWLWPRRLHALEGERGLTVLLRGQFFHCPAVSYRVELLRDRAWNDRWRQVMDLELYARILLDGGTIALEPRRVYRYRRHPGSMTQINSGTLVRSLEETALCRELARDAAALGWRRAARAGRIRFAVRAQALLRALTLPFSGRLRDARRALRLAVAP